MPCSARGALPSTVLSPAAEVVAHAHARARAPHAHAPPRASIGSLSSPLRAARYVRRMGAIGVGANIALGYATELLHLPLVYPLATIVTRRATTLPSSKLEAGVAVAACPRRVWGHGMGAWQQR